MRSPRAPLLWREGVGCAKADSEKQPGKAHLPREQASNHAPVESSTMRHVRDSGCRSVERALLLNSPPVSRHVACSSLPRRPFPDLRGVALGFLKLEAPRVPHRILAGSRRGHHPNECGDLLPGSAERLTRLQAPPRIAQVDVLAGRTEGHVGAQAWMVFRPSDG